MPSSRPHGPPPEQEDIDWSRVDLRRQNRRGTSSVSQFSWALRTWFNIFMGFCVLLVSFVLCLGASRGRGRHLAFYRR